MAHQSTAEDLALHGLRVLGYAEAPRIAGRYGLDRGIVQEYLLDHQARGWVSKARFGASSGWSLTDAGRAEDERRLAAELAVAGTGARREVVAAHQQFLPLNDRLGTACTNWQIRPAPGDPLAVNDHSDPRWDDRVLVTLASVGSAFRRLCGPLAGSLARFGGYADLYAAALTRAQAGQYGWIDAPDRDSCHLVWMQFHEDLLATLGLDRGGET
jgi:hypothetical protein